MLSSGWVRDLVGQISKSTKLQGLCSVEQVLTQLGTMAIAANRRFCVQ